jgi:hypothetical protein
MSNSTPLRSLIRVMSRNFSLLSASVYIVKFKVLCIELNSFKVLGKSRKSHITKSQMKPMLRDTNNYTVLLFLYNTNTILES